jgi:hypothetical protein
MEDIGRLRFIVYHREDGMEEFTLLHGWKLGGVV